MYTGFYLVKRGQIWFQRLSYNTIQYNLYMDNQITVQLVPAP